MNIEDYIASGKLESYAMGICTDAEKAEVESMLLQYPALKSELEEIEKAMEAYGQSQAVKPSDKVRENVMKAIQNRSNETPVIQMQPSPEIRSNKFNWLAAASIVLLIGSAIGNVMLYDKYQSTQSKVIALESEKTFLANDLQSTQANYQQMNDMLAMINSPKTMMVEMKGMPMSPESKAMIFWNQESSDVYLSIAALPDAPSQMQYQLWAIVDGVPVDAGMIDLTKNDGMPHKMKSFENASAFAVSLEKKGGSPTPNMEAIYVMGAVES
ncbi:MAG: anti-sigma factor domain-containing protein [Flavobacteriales bacterium]